MRTRNKIFALLSTLCLTVSVASATNSPFVYTPDYSDGTANVYTYEPYSQYEINTVVGFVTDIQLRQNEKVTKIATGDSVQWLVDNGYDINWKNKNNDNALFYVTNVKNAEILIKGGININHQNKIAISGKKVGGVDFMMF